MTKIISFCSSKGGVGKSTTCACVASALLHKNKTVHIIDLDSNKTLETWFSACMSPIKGLSVEAVSQDEFIGQLREKRGGENPPDFILIDVAGVYEKSMLLAMGRSDLVIIPTQPSQPDMREVLKVVDTLKDMLEALGGHVPYKVLFNLFDPLCPSYQKFAVEQVIELGLNRFDTALYKRAPYREIFMTDELPHFADQSRVTVQKAVSEIGELMHEIEEITVKQLEAA